MRKITEETVILLRSAVKKILDKAKQIGCSKGCIEDLTAVYEAQTTSTDKEIKAICDSWGEKELLKYIDKLLEETRKGGRYMSKKSIQERFNAPKDWDFDYMVENYGQEYLAENDPDSEPISMDDLDEYFRSPWEAIRSSFYGGRYGHKNDSFVPVDEYFAFNGAGNIISIPDFVLTEYLKDEIVEEEFYDWCVDQGYYEPEEEDED